MKALEELNIADYMASVTISMFEDKRLFLNAVCHVRNAILFAIKDFYKRKYPDINTFPETIIEDFISNETEFKKYFKMIEDINSFYKNSRGQSIKIKKNEKYVVISEDYKISAMTLEQLKEYIQLAREFINSINKN